MTITGIVIAIVVVVVVAVVTVPMLLISIFNNVSICDFLLICSLITLQK